MSARAAVALAAANVAAGVLNYLFQVHAATALDAASFGLFSAWLAQITFAGSIATVVQFVSLDHRAPERRFGRLVAVSGIGSAVLVLAMLSLGARLSGLALGAAAVASSTLLYAVVGQLQARIRLGDAALAIFVGAATRLGLPLLRGSGAVWFYVAQAAAPFAAVVVAALLVAARRANSNETRSGTASPLPATTARLRLARPVLLAFVTVLFPQLDVLALSMTQDATTLGTFSRIALAARVVFFGGAAIVQVLLPHQIHAAERSETRPSFVRLAERWIAPLALLGALALAAFVDAVVLRLAGDPRLWLYASCLSAALLVSVLGRVQLMAAAGQLRSAAVCVGAVLVASGIAAAAFGVTGYVVAVACAEAIVLAVAFVLPTGVASPP